MSKKFVVGLTGGIGSGKTAASDWFAAHGVDIVDTDVIAREVVGENSPALLEIEQCFGKEAITTTGELNRPFLRQLIFSNVEAKQQLEAITHPRIHASLIAQIAASTSPYCLLVSALLLESTQANLVDRILLIDVPVELQLARASLRDGHSSAHIQKIIDTQLPRTHKSQRADDIVQNTGSLAELHEQLANLHQHYLQLSRPELR